LFSAESIDFIDASTNNITNVVYEFLMLISIAIYWIISISILVQHKRKLPDNFSYRSERLTFNWTSLIVFLNILIFTLSFLSPFLRGEKLALDPGFVFHFNFSLFGFLLLLFGLLQPAIYNQSALAEKLGQTLENKQVKYKRSGLSNDELTKTADEISRYFEHKKPYLNPEFDLQTMAEELQLSRQILSQTMNEIYHKNFYRLVNEYRVNSVIQKMNNPAFAHLNLLGLGFESGFNSKASFNRVFKEITGKTPSAFKNKN
jgi:AraC-like DNA-binding protein